MKDKYTTKSYGEDLPFLWSLLRCESAITIMRNSGALLPMSDHSPEIINNEEKVCIQARHKCFLL